MPDERPATEPKSEPKPVKLAKLHEIALPAAVLALDASRDGRTLFAACQDGGVYRLEGDPMGPPQLLGRHESYASGIALAPDGRTLLSGGYDGRLLWHDLDQGKVIRSVQAHQFWSWDMDLSTDGARVASVTGRYEAGGYKYEPAPEREPSVKVFDAKTGELRQQWSHVPPVQAVAISRDNRF